MKDINLTEEEIVNKAIDVFISIPELEKTSFTDLVSKALSVNALIAFEGESLWKMYNMFLKECKKRKIKVVHNDDGRITVGIPYHLRIWRSDHPIIAKIIFNESHSCWGNLSRMSRHYVVFEKHNITYCNEPLDMHSNEDNCLIKVSYDPTNDYEFRSCYDDRKTYDFDELCKMVELSLNDRCYEYQHICDAEPASIVICYDDRKRRTISNICSKTRKYINEIAKSFAPDCFKMATGRYSKDDKLDI